METAIGVVERPRQHTMPDPKQILCIKWGAMYGPEYVNCLYGMVSRNITGEFNLVCFTDDASGIRAEVQTLPLPELGCPIPEDVPGKWPKQALWAEDLFGLDGLALYLDLDSVIVDSIDPYFTHGDLDGVYVARNWVNPHLKQAQTSVFRFRIGQHSYMLENLRKAPETISRKYQFEQNYVTEGIRGGVQFWPPRWTRHFRMHCMGPWPLRYVRPPKLPRGARIVTFPGRPKPPDAAAGRWRPSTPHRTRIGHLQFALAKKRETGAFLKYLKRYLQPTPWVEAAWQP